MRRIMLFVASIAIVLTGMIVVPATASASVPNPDITNVTIARDKKNCDVLIVKVYGASGRTRIGVGLAWRFHISQNIMSGGGDTYEGAGGSGRIWVHRFNTAVTSFPVASLPKHAVRVAATVRRLNATSEPIGSGATVIPACNK